MNKRSSKEDENNVYISIPLENVDAEMPEKPAVIMKAILKELGWLTPDDIRKIDDKLESRYNDASAIEEQCDDLMRMGLLFRRSVNGEKFYHANPDIPGDRINEIIDDNAERDYESLVTMYQ
jgi:hypothetical protein